MGKNKTKNKSTKPAAQPNEQIITKKVVPNEELTSEDKERLIKEGNEEKMRLIKDGSDEKERIIKEAQKEGEREKEKILDEAKKEEKRILEQATKKRDEALKEYKQQIFDEAKDDIAAMKEKAKREIKEDKEKLIRDKEEETNILNSLRIKESEFNQKYEKYLDDYAGLMAEKETYKSEVLSGLKTEMDSLIEKAEGLESENVSLKSELKRTKKELEAAEEDRDTYENDSADASVSRATCTALELRVKGLEEENAETKKLVSDYQKEITKKNTLLLKFGDNPDELVKENIELRTQLENQETFIANCPTEEELEKLRSAADFASQLDAEVKRLNTELSQKEILLRNATTYQEDLDNYKRFIRVLQLQKNELQLELDRIIETYNNSSSNVFPMLSKIDKKPIPPSHSLQKISLKDLCDNFRAYMATRPNNPLYYSEVHIRTFIAAFASTRLIILQGMSGTGKSSLPMAFKEYVSCVCDDIPVQPSWKDKNDLLGFYNDFEKKYKETEFLTALYEATRDSDNIHCIVLDEMNLSRIEYYFADMLSKLEKENPQDWKINLIASDVHGELPEYIQDGYLQILTNTWFIGTANNDDSTFNITDKVYDRAIVLDFKKREDPIKGLDAKGTIHLSNSEFQNLLSKATAKCKDEDALDSLVKKLDGFMKELFEISFGNRISKQMKLFVAAYEACGGTMTEAVDVIFSTKVLRKLQGLYDESTKENIDLLRSELNDLYKDPNEFYYSKEVLKNMSSKLGN